MKNTLPLISVIIPARTEEETKEAIKALKEIKYPQGKIEILLTLGSSPSRQRNLAAKKAKGEIIYFLDNDSEIFPNSFKKVVAAFKDERIGEVTKEMRGFSVLPKFLCRYIEDTFFAGKKTSNEIVAVGGPSIWNKDESFWSSVGGIVFESFFAGLNMCSRFRSIGKMRRAGERELVLCNLAVKKKSFFKIGGFKEELYPNEENEFLTRLVSRNFDCYYHPGVLINKPHRSDFKSIIKTFFIYGQGRMENIRVAGFHINSPVIPPLGLLFYLVILFFYHPWWFFLPLLFYFSLGSASAIGHASRKKKNYLAIILPFIFLIAHLSYAVGIFKGIFTDLKLRKYKGRKKTVVIKRIQSFASNGSFC